MHTIANWGCTIEIGTVHLWDLYSSSVTWQVIETISSSTNFIIPYTQRGVQRDVKMSFRSFQPVSDNVWNIPHTPADLMKLNQFYQHMQRQSSSEKLNKGFIHIMVNARRKEFAALRYCMLVTMWIHIFISLKWKIYN